MDAYDGTVTLYAWDDEDPILTTWENIFPGTLTDKSEMSDDLLAHIRYPADLFKVQRAVLATYHVTNPTDFYSGTDAWTTPDDPASAVEGTTQPPYYLTMQAAGRRRSGVHALLELHPAHLGRQPEHPDGLPRGQLRLRATTTASSRC